MIDPTLGHEHVTAKTVGLEGFAAKKAAWAQVETDAHSSQAVAKAKALGFEKATGFYKGKPILPDTYGGDGNEQLLIDKLVKLKGFDPAVAAKIAAKQSVAVAAGVKAKLGVK